MMHYRIIVHNYLNIHYNGMWIGRSGSVAWPPRSWFLFMGISQECCICTMVNKEREYDKTHSYGLCSLVEFYSKQ